MTNTMNAYDTLYNNLKNRLTVISDQNEYTVGEYMLMKAKENESSNLPSTFTGDSHAIVAIVNFVNDRLTVKAPPVKDKTMKRFPLRTSFSALLSAVAATALMVSCCLYAIAGTTKNGIDYTARTEISEEIEIDSVNN